MPKLRAFRRAWISRQQKASSLSAWSNAMWLKLGISTWQIDRLVTLEKVLLVLAYGVWHLAYHLAGCIQDSRREGSAQEAHKPQSKHSDGPMIDLQQEGQHCPGQQAARHVHEVCVQ